MLKFLKGIFSQKNKLASQVVATMPSVTDESNIVIENNIEVQQEITVEPELPAAPEEKDTTSIYLDNYQFPTLELLSKEAISAYMTLFDIGLNNTLPIFWKSTLKDIIFKDLSEMGALLIAGTQSTGKTNFLHQIIIGWLFKKHPSQLKLLLIDTTGVEFFDYRLLEHHFLAKRSGQNISVIKEVPEIFPSLFALLEEMANRQELLQSAGVKNSKAYNAKFIARELDLSKGHHHLPDIVLIMEDFGSLSYSGSEHGFNILTRIVSEGYKTGIYSILSTSQINGTAIPGHLLSAITHRIVFRLNSKDDYRRFLDTTRFDVPYAKGSFMFNDGPRVLEGASVLLQPQDVKHVVDFISEQLGYAAAYIIGDVPEDIPNFSLDDLDPLLEEAARLIVDNQVGSTSLIQRRMKLGYNRAARIMDQLEAIGIVGGNEGSKVRDVLFGPSDNWQEIIKHFKDKQL